MNTGAAILTTGQFLLANLQGRVKWEALRIPPPSSILNSGTFLFLFEKNKKAKVFCLVPDFCSIKNQNFMFCFLYSHFRVIGVENIRILDASIQPKIVNTNLIASTLMIAEKGVEDVLMDNKY